jgi:hypothetical protein
MVRLLEGRWACLDTGGMLEDWEGEFRRLGAQEGMWVH